MGYYECDEYSSTFHGLKRRISEREYNNLHPVDASRYIYCRSMDYEEDDSASILSAGLGFLSLLDPGLPDSSGSSSDDSSYFDGFGGGSGMGGGADSEW